MKTILKLAAAVTLLVFTHSAAGNDTRTRGFYEVTIPQDDHRIAIVEATLLPTDELFYMFPGAEQFPARWATFVSNFEVRDEQGAPVPYSAGDDGTWRLASVPDGWVSIRYQVNLEHEDHEWSAGVDGAAYARPWGVFYTTRSLFVVNGEERDDILITFRVPANWKVTTPWQAAESSALQFSVPDQNALATSIIFAGTHREIAIENGSFSLLLALGGDHVTAQEDMFVDMATSVLDYYVELMGDTPRLSSSEARGVPVVIINEADMTDGEALGNNISMLLEPGGDPMSQIIVRLLFAHEFFHLWNGKSFTPAGDDGEWFKEGFTNYYALKALREIDFFSEESCVNALGGFFYQRYNGDDAVGTRSITEGELKHSNWGLVYVGGMLVAVAQDVLIRTATRNQRSLDDLMRHMFDHFGEGNYSVADLEQALTDLSGQDQAEFFRRHVYGAERVPVTEALALAGIEMAQEDGRTVFTIRETSDVSPCYARH